MALSPSVRRVLPIILTILVGLLIGLATRVLAPSQPIAIFVWAVVSMAATAAASVYCWRALDEVAREAHKTAWMWGGSFGMLAAFLALIAAKQHWPHLLEVGFGGARNPADLVEFGVMSVVLAQLAGYLIVWAGWWISRR
jgi:hypothetical protein